MCHPASSHPTPPIGKYKHLHHQGARAGVGGGGGDTVGKNQNKSSLESLLSPESDSVVISEKARQGTREAVPLAPASVPSQDVVCTQHSC